MVRLKNTAPGLYHRTKIVCTIGPATEKLEQIRKLIYAGADIFRLNFSHGSQEDHLSVYNAIRQAGQEVGRPYAVLGDLSGPKLRVGNIFGGERKLIEGERLILTSEEVTNESDERIHVNFSGFHEVATSGEKILLDDGKLALLVDYIEGPNVICNILNNGILKSKKGVNLPDTRLPIPALTEKDKADLKFACRNNFDVLALSFVRTPEDIQEAKAAIKAEGKDIPIIAKIEKKEAVDNLDEILELADGAMVARGDLGIEIPMEKVPAAQKKIIHACNRHAKPVITATQMLESMVTSPRPTRAEITDVYNAIHDGTSAVMLSGETAVGDYPFAAVEIMNTVAHEAEQVMEVNHGLEWVMEEGETPSVTHSITEAAVKTAESLKLDLIIVPTSTGYSAFHVSRFKPSVPIFACSTHTDTVNRLCLAWGVTSRTMSHLDDKEVEKSQIDALINEVKRTALYHGVARHGQRAVVIGGIPLGQTRHTNFLHVVEL